MLKWNFYFAKNCMHEKSMLIRLQTVLHRLFLDSLKVVCFSFSRYEKEGLRYKFLLLCQRIYGLWQFQKKEKWYRKLRHKYRLVIFHDETFEEKVSFRLSRLNVFITLVSLAVVLIFVTSYIIAFTSLREYIPGYTDIGLNQRIYEIENRADSLERVFQQKDRYIANIKRIVDGYDAEQDSIETFKIQNDVGVSAIDTIEFSRSQEDSLLRLEFESAERFNLYDQGAFVPESRRRAMKVANFFLSR